MKLGADRKRIATLGGLVLIGGYVIWSSFFSDSSSSSDNTVRTAAAPAPVISSPADTSRVSTRRKGQSRPTEWSPGIDGKPLDPLKVDPTLRLDLLAKVQQVGLSSAQRNLFQFGESAPVAPAAGGPLPAVKKINLKGPGPQPIVASGPPPKALPPPITLKYYGYSNPRSSPRKKAFFLDGDEIIVAGEGDLMKKRYRLLKIGINSVTVEDTQFNNTEQVLPLAEEAANG